MGGRELLMIPGPIEFESDVLQAMGTKTLSHVSQDFVEIFGETLEDLRDVFLTEQGQPFVVPGSGTLAMDMAAANLVEAGDRVLVVNTGYFSDRFASVCSRYGAEVVEAKTELGDRPALEEVEEALEAAEYKLLIMTHVDTSTGVAVNVEDLGALARDHNTLSVVDGVCALAGMEFRQDDWGIDVCVTGSQKALGVPPGLALLMVGPRAIEAFEARETPVPNYYVDFANWRPIMEAYETRRPSYFATPAVNLIFALHESLKHILAEGMQSRFRRHRLMSRAFQAGMEALGLKQVPVSPAKVAHTMTAVYYPEGVGTGLLARIRANGVIVAGGIHPQIIDKYFRVGHMGSVSPSDILTTVGAIERGLAASDYEVELGTGLAAAQKVLVQF